MDLTFQPVRWESNQLILLDQAKLPLEVDYRELTTVEDVWVAIRNLAVRGANAIGITAAYGLYLGVREFTGTSRQEFIDTLETARRYLETSRPTAVHMFWAMNRVKERIRQLESEDIDTLKAAVLAEAQEIQEDDIHRCKDIGVHALSTMVELRSEQSALGQPVGILTHCNAGALGTSYYGTATAPMYLAHEQGWDIRVFADETRPVLQGARLTTWELQQAGIDVTLICDNMAATVMRKGWVQVVFVGADRIAANGDTANKIGTYGVAVLAKEHGIPFYVAAPTSTIDMGTPSGEDIVIEERPEEEITEGLGKRIAPNGVKVYNPAFDVTPADLITGIVTEKGVIRAPFGDNIRAVMEA